MSKKPTAKSVTCVRLIRDTPPSLYALPTDGRKYKEQQQKRRALAMQLATFADGDGTRIHPGATRLMEALGWQRDTLFRYLDDLGRLGFLGKEGRTKMRGTRQRFLNLDAIQRKLESEVGETKSTRLAEQESEVHAPESEIEKPQSEVEKPESGIGEQEPEIAPYTTVTKTVTQTGTQNDTHTTENEAEESVCVLLQRADDSWAWNKPVGSTREKIKNHAKQNGREKFLAAGDAFIKDDHNFNKKTYSPWTTFADNFRHYLDKATKRKPALTQEIIDRSNEIANAAHEALWAVPEKEEPTAEDFLEDDKK